MGEMNEGDPLMMEERGEVYKEGMRDNSEEEKYCCCFSMKCGVISIGIYVIIDLLTDIYMAFCIS
tara:strand:- start:529 stop:723 length:195 start_codon:yes stop_codon:yes gene_type:complete